MMKRLIGFLSCIVILLTFLGCERTECTSRQHFEIMQDVRPFKDGIILFNPPPLSKLIYDVDEVLRIGISKKTYREDVLSMVKFLCNYHGTSFKAFNRAHEKLGILNLPYDEELKIYVNQQWKKPRYGRWFVQDKEGRIITCEDLEYDLGFNSGPDHLTIVLDENGIKNIYGFEPDDAEFDSLLRVQYSLNPIWHIKTYRDVKTEYVFDLMEEIKLIALDNGDEENKPEDGRFVFSEIFDTCFKEMKLLVSSDLTSPNSEILDSVEFTVYLKESGTILLNAKEQSSIQALAATLNEIAQNRDIKADIVVNDEVPWTRALQLCSQLTCSIILHRSYRYGESE
jgi:hypothetical protein